MTNDDSITVEGKQQRRKIMKHKAIVFYGNQIFVYYNFKVPTVDEYFLGWDGTVELNQDPEFSTECICLREIDV